MDSRGRADDIRLISAGAVPILSMIEHRFVHVNAASPTPEMISRRDGAGSRLGDLTGTANIDFCFFGRFLSYYNF